MHTTIEEAPQKKERANREALTNWISAHCREMYRELSQEPYNKDMSKWARDLLENAISDLYAKTTGNQKAG